MLSRIASRWFWGSSCLLAAFACGGRIGEDVDALNGSVGGSASRPTGDVDQGGSSLLPLLQDTGGNSAFATSQAIGGNSGTLATRVTGGSLSTGGSTNALGGAAGGGGASCLVAYNGNVSSKLVTPELCGNGIPQLDNGEECDDGNHLSGDGCSPSCRIETYWICPKACELCIARFVCGDGKLDPGEFCDDGNTQSGDGCSNVCQHEPSFVCAPGQLCCGNGILEEGEQCDQGADNTDDCGPCTSACTKGPYCGDGVLQARCGETCDDGINSGAYGSCSPSCSLPMYCGDGIVQPEGGEQCDLGSLNGTGVIVDGTASKTCTLSCTVVDLVN